MAAVSPLLALPRKHSALQWTLQAVDSPLLDSSAKFLTPLAEARAIVAPAKWSQEVTASRQHARCPSQPSGPGRLHRQAPFVPQEGRVSWRRSPDRIERARRSGRGLARYR